MAKQKFGLGRGLDALLTGASDVMAAQQLQQQPAPIDVDTVPVVPIESIIPNPRQPRRNLQEDDPRLLELSASIKEHGLLQPIIVVRLESQKPKLVKESSDTSGWFSGEEAAPVPSVSEGATYQIIAGERRWRASRMAGLSKVPVVIKDVTPLQMLELALIENIQRADLNPVEEALAYQALVQEFGLTQEMVAKQVGKDRTTITNSLRLLQLAPKVRDTLINQSESFTEGHARTLVGIADEDQQIQAMQQIITLRMNVRQAEELAARMKTAENVEVAVQSLNSPPRRSSEMDDLVTHFRNALMVKVDVKCNAKGKGTVVLHFNNQEELDSLYNRLVKPEEA